nr:hypothetical protein CFP56_04512 [Quercus suber]
MFSGVTRLCTLVAPSAFYPEFHQPTLAPDRCKHRHSRIFHSRAWNPSLLIACPAIRHSTLAMVSHATFFKRLVVCATSLTMDCASFLLLRNRVFALPLGSWDAEQDYRCDLVPAVWTKPPMSRFTVHAWTGGCAYEIGILRRSSHPINCFQIRKSQRHLEKQTPSIPCRQHPEDC